MFALSLSQSPSLLTSMIIDSMKFFARFFEGSLAHSIPYFLYGYGVSPAVSRKGLTCCPCAVMHPQVPVDANTEPKAFNGNFCCS